MIGIEPLWGQPMTIPWDPAWATGLAAIDDDHRELVNLANRYLGAVEGGAGLGSTTGILRNLALFFKFHVSKEERMMVALGYPELDEHRCAHRVIAEGIDALLERSRTGADCSELVRTLFGRFIAHHGSGIDRKLVRFLERHRPPTPAAEDAAAQQDGVGN